MTSLSVQPKIAVLGASGLIGEALTRDLLHAGYVVVPLARRFTAAQAAAIGHAVTSPLVELSVEQLKVVLDGVDVVVNCVGVLQDGGKGRTAEVHEDFVRRLLAACGQHRLLIHLSIPDRATPDETAFSQTKRRGEELIRASGVSYIILRPGFVVGEAAYGGSALIRALAAWPMALPARYADVAFAATDIHDIGRAVAAAAGTWAAGMARFAETWDLLERDPSTVGEVIAAFRLRLCGSGKLWTTPAWLLTFGTLAGDLAARLGWSPPIRTTAIVELSRGVRGDPAQFTLATGIVPQSLAEILTAHPATVQEKWFSRLYLLKALTFAGLVVFWVLSGLIALVLSFDAATRILTFHGVPEQLARGTTFVSSCIDIAVGLLIASRRTARFGLWTGIIVSLGYMLGAAILTPEMWIEPLGALVKTGPAIVLMGIALAILDER